MFRSAIAAALAAFLVLVAPSAALAYEDNDDDNVSVTDPNPGAGEVFGVEVEAGDCPMVAIQVNAPSDAVTIDGEATNSASKAPVDGTATFEVAIDTEGSYSITATCETTDEVLGEQMVVVGDVAAQPMPNANGGLPDTGADGTTTVLAVGGVMLLLGGAAALFLSRRRRPHAG